MEVNGFIIEPQNGEAGANKISISVPAVNEGIDKVVEVDAVCGDQSDRLTLVHEGLRQRFITADGKVFCVKGGGRLAVLKHKQKKVNQLRWAIVSAGKIGGKLVNADTLEGNGSWDYPVASDVDILASYIDGDGLSETDGLFFKFLAGERDVQTLRYVPMGATDFTCRCEPAEDGTYIYEVVVTDLR